MRISPYYILTNLRNDVQDYIGNQLIGMKKL